MPPGCVLRVVALLLPTTAVRQMAPNRTDLKWLAMGGGVARSRPAHVPNPRIRASLMRGGSSDGTNNLRSARIEVPSADSMVTGLLIVAWYGFSVVNNQSSNLLVGTLGAEALTLAQLLISAAIGAAVLASTGESPRTGLSFASRGQLIDTCALAVAFLAGVRLLPSNCRPCLAAAMANRLPWPMAH